MQAYPAVWVAGDSNSGTWTDQQTVWLAAANGETLDDTKRYLARCWGADSSGTAIWMTEAQGGVGAVLLSANAWSIALSNGSPFFANPYPLGPLTPSSFPPWATDTGTEVDFAAGAYFASGWVRLSWTGTPAAGDSVQIGGIVGPFTAIHLGQSYLPQVAGGSLDLHFAQLGFVNSSEKFWLSYGLNTGATCTLSAPWVNVIKLA